jgi:HK97 family phage major capsid protein
MKKSDALKQTRASKLEAQKRIIDLAKAENREFTTEENTQLTSMDSEVEALDSQIEEALTNEAREMRISQMNAQPVTHERGAGEEKEFGKVAKRFSILSALRSAMNGQEFEGAEKEMHEIGMAENRNAGVTAGKNTRLSLPVAYVRATQQTVTQDSAGFGGALVQNQAPMMVDTLRPSLFLEELGATVMTGLSGGNIPLIRKQDFTMAFLAEGAAITPHKKEFSGPTLSPKRAGGAVDITNQLIMQSSPDVEAIVMEGLRNGFSDLLNGAAINGAGGVAPTGILNYVGINESAITANAAATWALIQELQGLIEEDNSTSKSLGWLIHPKLKSILKQIKVDAGSGIFLANNETIDGVRYIATSLIPVLTDGDPAVNVYPLIYGDFSQLYVGQWGAMNIGINPYSADLSDSLRLVLNTHADVQIAQPKCFAVNAFLKAATS